MNLSSRLFFFFSSFFFLLFLEVSSRKHHLRLDGDSRRFFPISNFGFYAGGYLAVNLTHFSAILPGGGDNDTLDRSQYTLGFSIDRTTNDALNPYVETSQNECILDTKFYEQPDQSDSILGFTLNFETMKTHVTCSENIGNLHIFPSEEKMKKFVEGSIIEEGGKLSDSHFFQSPKKQAAAKAAAKAAEQEKSSKKAKRAAVEAVDAVKPSKNHCDHIDLALTQSSDPDKEVTFSTAFYIYIANEKEEGLYSLYFHNCHNYGRRNRDKVVASFTIDIEEKNNDSYLSAGEMPLPALYLLMSSLFFLSGCFWVFILRKNGTEQVYRIHWLMAALVYLKSLSLFFHGVNYHKIETNGFHIESWAILYYVTHLLKGGLLFFTIVLIGSGWAFIKHVLSDREKRVFILVLPLQVLANVAYIIIEESEQGEERHSTWKDIFIIVDLMCCAAILLPVVWSIKHLQESSQTDGKATVSLEKLKLFRHFYIMVVCYIYVTRIIVYLLKITVPFQYEWLDEMFKEMANFVFFVMTGYKFRPASNNPYFSVATDDYDMEEVLIGGTAINEQVTNRKTKRVFVDDDESEDDEGMVFFPGGSDDSNSRRGSNTTIKTEISHDLD